MSVCGTLSFHPVTPWSTVRSPFYQSCFICDPVPQFPLILPPPQHSPATRMGPLCCSMPLNSSCWSLGAERALCACSTSASGSCSTLSRPTTQPLKPWRWIPTRTSLSLALQRATWRWRLITSNSQTMFTFHSVFKTNLIFPNANKQFSPECLSLVLSTGVETGRPRADALF